MKFLLIKNIRIFIIPPFRTHCCQNPRDPPPLGCILCAKKTGVDVLITNERRRRHESRIEGKDKGWRAGEEIACFDCANLPSTSFRRSGPSSRGSQPRSRNTRSNVPIDRSFADSSTSPRTGNRVGSSGLSASSNYAVNAIKTRKSREPLHHRLPADGSSTLSLSRQLPSVNFPRATRIWESIDFYRYFLEWKSKEAGEGSIFNEWKRK